MCSGQNKKETMQESVYKTQEAIALERCEKQIEWYVNATKRRRRLFYWSHGLAIFFGGTTPVLVVLLSLTSSYEGLLMGLIALFPALSATITGLDGVFQWREELSRFGYTAESLKS